MKNTDSLSDIPWANSDIAPFFIAFAKDYFYHLQEIKTSLQSFGSTPKELLSLWEMLFSLSQKEERLRENEYFPNILYSQNIAEHIYWNFSETADVQEEFISLLREWGIQVYDEIVSLGVKEQIDSLIFASEKSH